MLNNNPSIYNLGGAKVRTDTLAIEYSYMEHKSRVHDHKQKKREKPRNRKQKRALWSTHKNTSLHVWPILPIFLSKFSQIAAFIHIPTLPCINSVPSSWTPPLDLYSGPTYPSISICNLHHFFHKSPKSPAPRLSLPSLQSQMAALSVFAIASLISFLRLVDARIPGVYMGGPWQSAHATFYGGSDASGTMGAYLSCVFRPIIKPTAHFHS